MKIIRYEHAGLIAFGELSGNKIRSIAAKSLLELMEASADDALGISSASEWKLNIEDVRLLAPIQPSRNLFCVGWNYLKHYNESKGKRGNQEVELPDRPTFFTKLPTTIAGPFDDLPLHQKYTSKLDWEVELAVVIGKDGRDIKEENALDHVFGFAVANDISARDLQKAHGAQWFKGKSLDSTCPIGPCIVTADEIQDVQNLKIQCKLNGQVVQESRTDHQIFSVARIISELSSGLTLKAGDVILTGTPEGIGAARVPPLFLAHNDIVECTVEGIGTIRNQIKDHL